MTCDIDVPHELIHIGMVCRDMETAQQHLTSTLGIRWEGGQIERWDLTIYGQPRNVAIRIAHGRTETSANNSGPQYELIESVANTPWETEALVSLHHLCIHGPDTMALCAHFERKGWQRVLGLPGDSSGYFQQEDGLLIEVVDDSLRDYLAGFHQP